MQLDVIFVLTFFVSGFLSACLLGIDSKDSSQILGELSDKAKKSPRAQLWDELTARSRFILGIAAVVLCATALLVNISTWFSDNIVWSRILPIALDMGIGILLFASVALERWRWRMLGSKKQTFTFPRWSKAAFAALFVYVAVEFGFDILRLYRQQALSNLPHGTVHLEITAEEQAQNQKRVVRGFSGIWILLSSFSAGGLLLMKNEPYDGPFGKFNRMLS